MKNIKHQISTYSKRDKGRGVIYIQTYKTKCMLLFFLIDLVQPVVLQAGFWIYSLWCYRLPLIVPQAACVAHSFSTLSLIVFLCGRCWHRRRRGSCVDLRFLQGVWAGSTLQHLSIVVFCFKQQTNLKQIFLKANRELRIETSSTFAY